MQADLLEAMVENPYHLVVPADPHLAPQVLRRHRVEGTPHFDVPVPADAPLPEWATGGIVYAATAAPTGTPRSCVMPDAPGLPGGQLVHGAADAAPVWHDGVRLGATWTDGFGTWLHLAGLGGSDPTLPRPEQAARCYDRCAQVLAAHGFGFTDVVRTWFQLDRILDWYDDFNRVRSARLAGQAPAAAPASTAVGGRTHDGGAISLALLALKPAPGVHVATLRSPLQGPAPAYGSRFSRALRIDAPGASWLTVSGTASIAPDGRTARVGDLPGQVALTVDVLDALLSAQDCPWSAVDGAVLYVSPGVDPAQALVLTRARLGAVPLIASVQQVCRGDLLVEIELDARLGG